MRRAVRHNADDEPTDAERKRLGGPVPRQLYRTGGSLVVAVPSHVVKYLEARPGMQLWWWLGESRGARVTMSPRNVGGRPAGLHAAKELAAALAENDRLRRRLGSRPAAVYHEGVNEGRMRHMGELVKLGAQLDTVIARLDALERRMPWARRAARRLAASSAPRIVDAGSVDAIPPPESLTPSVEVERGADTLGQPAPGVPL